MEKYQRKLVIAGTIIAAYLFIGTIIFHIAEGWSYIDAFYFSGITLTTVGYGDFVPTHSLTKIFTVIFAFSGISIVFYSVSVIARMYFEREEERLQKIWESTHNPAIENSVTRPISSSIRHMRKVSKKLKHIRKIRDQKHEESKKAMIDNASSHNKQATNIMQKED